MEGIHVGFGRRICTDASSKPLPITTVLSAVFSSPWHKSDGQNCVAPAMERFSSEFWCGGRRNTRVFQGRQAGNHRKSPMSGGTDPFHVCPCFLPVNLVFVAAFAALVVSFPGTCPGKDGLLFGRRDNRQSPFSPRAPLSGSRGRQSSRFAELLLAEGECHCCFSGFARKTFRTSSLFTITYNFSLRAPLSFSRCVFAEQNELL